MRGTVGSIQLSDIGKQVTVEPAQSIIRGTLTSLSVNFTDHNVIGELYNPVAYLDVGGIELRAGLYTPVTVHEEDTEEL